MSAKKVLILKGSPRRNSNSSILADRVADGAREAGAEIQSFDLDQMDIHPCMACETCRGKGAGECAVDDGMSDLYPHLRTAHAIVVATPVYWSTVSAQTKLCMDRWYALASPQGSALKGKQFALVLAYGDRDPYTSGAVNAIHTFQDTCRFLQAEMAGMVYGSAWGAGEIRNRPELLQEAYELGRRLGS